MSKNNQKAVPPVWFNSGDVDLEQLNALSSMQTIAEQVPMADDVIHQIPVYDGAVISALAQVSQVNNAAVRALQREWVEVLLNGAGVLVIRNGVDDIDMLDEVSDVLLQILEEESTENNAGADHFAAAGTNSRIWNAHEKLCMRNPQLFARYNANDAFALVCGAWLGPGYQITAQVNVVHPGGRAQVCHRDYHLGFQGREVLVEYPSHVHSLSPLLTLQGGIAHSQVPLASGSTQLLPFSQQLLRGYMDVHDQRFIDYFNKHRVQVPLDKGDMLFFNPALFHAAGDNDTTDFHRFVNLFQVGSAYGRTLEIVDRARMSIHVYPVIQSMLEAGSLSQRDVGNVVAACAEGYPFPANLDLEPPVGGLAVPSQQAVMLKALKEGMQASEFTRLIHEQMSLKRSC